MPNESIAVRDALMPLTRDRVLERDRWRAAFAETASRSRPSLSMSEPSLPKMRPALPSACCSASNAHVIDV
jgi:hypothetical protein